MLLLEDLVPDILFHLLLNVESIDILWLFIRSSPRLFQVFRHKRDIILTVVIRRELGYEVEGDARFALRLSRVKPRGLSKQLALAYIAEYQASTSNGNTPYSYSDTQDYVQLWKIHRDVKFTAELFIGEKLSILAGAAISNSDFNVSNKIMKIKYSLNDISSTERIRIYRAIYRYAIYGYLFHFDSTRPQLFGSAHMTGQEQSHSFLTLFPAWQVEELSCINDFIQDQIRDRSQMVDHSFRDPGIELEEWHGKDWELEYFYTHSVRVVYHQDWQGYLTTLSLSELRKFFTADPKQLRDTALRYSNHHCKDFLTEALLATPYHRAQNTLEFRAQIEAIKSGIKVTFNGDSLNRPNEGWLWAHEYLPSDLYTEGEAPFSDASGLRRFGYVFWDCNRLRAADALAQKLISVASPIEFSEDTLRYSPRPVNPTYSIEERLQYGAFLGNRRGQEQSQVSSTSIQ